MSKIFSVLRYVFFDLRLYINLQRWLMTELNVNREESEAVSELKNVAGTSTVPSGALANGADGIKESITNFGDARKSDIDNEHLPPDLIDPEDFAAAAAAHHAALSSGEDDGSDVFGDVITPAAGSTAPTSPDMVASPELGPTTSSPKDAGGVPGTPTSEKDVSPLGSPVVENAGQAQFRRHHRRQSSLGTTRTSPSTRRRSLENTISMIREAMSKNDESMGQSLLPLRWCLFLRAMELTRHCVLHRGIGRKGCRKRISAFSFLPTQLDLCRIWTSFSPSKPNPCSFSRIRESLLFRFCFCLHCPVRTSPRLPQKILPLALPFP